jgi:hypothetical protein
MKLAEVARYWAAKELTAVRAVGGGLELRAPVACPDFTLRWRTSGVPISLHEVSGWQNIEPAWRRDGYFVTACIALKKAVNNLRT